MAEQLPLQQPQELLPYDGSALFIPDFLDLDLADQLFAELHEGVAWEQSELIVFGNKVSEPRFSSWHSDPGVTYSYSGTKRVPQPWLPGLSTLRLLCEERTNTTFNSALVNLYRTGLDHLGWHSDNELCNGPTPTIASISLGATRRFDMKHNDTGEVYGVHLQHGSLLVMAGLSQQKWVHRVPKTTKVGAARINVTFRFVDPSLEASP
jgi:alkylated DNA repair dioxygenase AlkB